MMKNGKRLISLCLAVFAITVNMACLTPSVFATGDLNEIGGKTSVTNTVEENTSDNVSTGGTSQTTTDAGVSNGTLSTGNTSSGSTGGSSNVTTPSTGSTSSGSSNTVGSSSNISESNTSSADAVGEIFKQGGLTSESVEKSKKWVEPVAKIINLAMAIVLGIFSALLVFISALDLVYLGVPFVRPYLMPNQPQQSGGMPSMGMHGMSMGMHGMSMGSQPQQSSAVSGIGQWISDDAKNALMEASNQQTQQPTMSMGMNTPAQQPKGKNLMFSYIKKRAFTLVMLGVCLVLFTCTIFTDIGVMLGMKLLALLSGISL